jgi:glutamate racemase
MKDEKIRIVVTDSGLGGLSVAAKIEKAFKELSLPADAEIIFFNSLPYSKFGYNLIELEKDRIKLFDSALSGMKKHYNPDLIVIACNTLSVLFPKTKFASKEKIAVCGIIEPGVDILFKKLEESNESTAIILGTETTVLSNVHKIELVKRGIKADRIINQPCKNLESEIQLDPNGKAAFDLIEKYVRSALIAVEQNFGKLYFALCCTHYQYSKDVFQNIISGLTKLPFEIIDPNEYLVESVLNHSFNIPKAKIDKKEIQARVICKFEIPINERIILSPLLKKDSPGFANSLMNFELNEELFDYTD